MRLKVVIILVIIVAVASAIYFYRDELFSSSELSGWDYVPSSAAIVWEIDDPIKEWNEFIDTDHWKNFSQVSDFSKINKSLTILDSLMGSAGKLDKIVEAGSFLFSIHTISSTSMDFVFYINLEDPEYQEEFIRISDHFRKVPDNKYSERIYRGQVIAEIKNKNSNRTFSYILYKNHFVGSYTPFLVEDVIRTVQNQAKGFQLENTRAFNLSSLEFDAGNI